MTASAMVGLSARDLSSSPSPLIGSERAVGAASAPEACNRTPLSRASCGSASGMSSQKNGKDYSTAEMFRAAMMPDGRAVAAFLREKFPVKTAFAVSAMAGVSPDAFRKWEAGVSSPSFKLTLYFIVRFGPEFLAAVLPQVPDWLDDDICDARESDLERRALRARADLDEYRAARGRA